jgi:hypothetical protein
MKGFIGVTDNDWFAFLSQQPGIDEVNFWQPSGQIQFRSLIPTENKREVAEVANLILAAIQWQFYDSPTNAAILAMGLS